MSGNHLNCNFQVYRSLCITDSVTDLLRSEKTKIGSMMSGALTSTLLGLAASNLGLIPFETPSYSFFMEFLLPHTIPLLLFRADLRRIIRSTGSLLLAFLIGSGKKISSLICKRS